MKITKLLTLTCTLALCTFALCSCGSGKDDSSDTTTATTAQTTTAESTTQPETTTEETTTPAETTTEETTTAKSDGALTAEDISALALDYYEAKTGYRPAYAEASIEGTTATIQLYDLIVDDEADGLAHTSTSDWYTIDTATLKGTNTLGEAVDLNEAAKN